MVGWISILLALLSAIAPAQAWQAGPFYPVVSAAMVGSFSADFSAQFRATYHNPNTGRFWTQDSYEGVGSDPASLHKYTYCGNNPVNSIDPSGHMDVTLGSIMYVSNISLQARIMLAGVTASIGGAVAALDTYVATDGQATAGQLASSFGTGAKYGALFGLAGGFMPVATMIAGAGLGGWSVGQAITAGNPRLALFRALTVGLGISVGARQLTTGYEYYCNGGQGRLYPNRIPDVQLAKPTPAYQIKATKLTGLFNFVVLKTGFLKLGQPGLNNLRNGHADLAYGQPVKAAGQVSFKDGEIEFYNDASGHYNQNAHLTPEDVAIQGEAAGEAFSEEGFNPNGKYDPVVGPNN